jgi:molybdopterin converting factor small subunit
MAEITVEVRLFASLRRFQPKGADGPIPLRLPAGAAVRDAVAALGIPQESAGIVVCNDVHLKLESPLQDGAEVSIFPPLAGGAGAAEEAARLRPIARRLREHVIRMITAAGSGHPGGSLSAAEIVTALRIVGGLGSAVCEALAETGIAVRWHAVLDFGESGTGERFTQSTGSTRRIEAAALRLLADRGPRRTASVRRSR